MAIHEAIEDAKKKLAAMVKAEDFGAKLAAFAAGKQPPLLEMGGTDDG